MRNNKRRRKKYRLNTVRIFAVTVLLLVFLGFIVTQRGRNLEAEQKRQEQSVSKAEEEQKKKSQETINQIFADESRYP